MTPWGLAWNYSGSTYPGVSQELGEEPFDSWFRERVSDIHGFDLTRLMPAPVQLLDTSF